VNTNELIRIIFYFYSPDGDTIGSSTLQTSKRRSRNKFFTDKSLVANLQRMFV